VARDGYVEVSVRNVLLLASLTIAAPVRAQSRESDPRFRVFISRDIRSGWFENTRGELIAGDSAAVYVVEASSYAGVVDDRVLAAREVRWSIDDTTVARLDTRARLDSMATRVVALRPGRVKLTARVADPSGQAARNTETLAVDLVVLPRGTLPTIAVSRSEVRLVLPTLDSVRSKPASAVWRVDFEGMFRTRALQISVDDSGASLTRTSRVEFCEGVMRRCVPVAATVSRDPLTIVVRDTNLIRQLFAHRPPFVDIVATGAGWRRRRTVTYVEPQLPMPTAAVIARADSATRTRLSNYWRYWYSLDSPNGSIPHVLFIGDTLPVRLDENKCVNDFWSDICTTRFHIPFSEWTFVDTTIATVVPDTSLAFDRDSLTFLPSVRIVPKRPGRAIMWIAPLFDPSRDSVPRAAPPEPVVTRPIYVSPRIGRVVLSGSDAAPLIGQAVTFAARVFDRQGDGVFDPPVQFRVVETKAQVFGGTTFTTAFDRQGVFHVLADFGGKADTVVVNVRPR
jgi:hypothetical protein